MTLAFLGEIDSRTPGGWYILSNVRTENDKLAFPLVVEPEHLKAVSMNDSKVKSTEGNKEGQDAMCADDVIKFYKSCVTSQNRYGLWTCCCRRLVHSNHCYSHTCVFHPIEVN